ncbi:unnamed protein product [Urochloa humidicola]
MVKDIRETSLKKDETNCKIKGMQQSIDRISGEQGEIQTWRPQLEGKVTDLQNSMSDLKLKVDLFIHELPKREAEGEVDLGVPAPAHLGAFTKAEVLGPNGHGEVHHHRSVGTGVVTTLVHTPVKGAKQAADVIPVNFQGFDSAVSPTRSHPLDPPLVILSMLCLN